MLSKLKVTTDTLWTLILMLVSIWVFDWIERKLLGHTTGLGIFIGWIVALMISYGINYFSKRDATEGERRGAGEH